MDTLFTGSTLLIVLFATFNHTPSVDELKAASTYDAAFSSVFQASRLESLALSLKSQEEAIQASGTDVLVGFGTVLSFWVVDGIEVDAGALVLEIAVLAVGTVSIGVVVSTSWDCSVADSIFIVEIGGTVQTLSVFLLEASWKHFGQARISLEVQSRYATFT